MPTEGVGRGIVVRGRRNADPRERVRESRPHGHRGVKEAQWRRPPASRDFQRKGSQGTGEALWMLAKCNENLVNGPQTIPQSNSWISTACSVMQYGCEEHISTSMPT